MICRHYNYKKKMQGKYMKQYHFYDNVCDVYNMQSFIGISRFSCSN